MIIVLVSTALREPFLSRYAASQATWDWFREQGYRVLRLVGDETIQDTVLEGDLLKTPVTEEWQSMGIKDWWAFRHLLQDEEVTGIIKMDDDVQISKSDQALKDVTVLQTHAYASFAVGVAYANVDIVYAQTRVRSTPWNVSPVRVPSTFAYGSGSFLYLSRETVKLFTSPQALVMFAQNPIEDLTIGLFCAKARVPLTTLASSAFSWGQFDKTLGSSEIDVENT